MRGARGRKVTDDRIASRIIIAVASAFALFLPLPASAADSLRLSVDDLPAIGAIGLVIVFMSVLLGSILTSSRLRGSSLFNRLFIVVAVSSGFFSAVSSAIGFALITSQENEDFLRNTILPPAFGYFVFFLAVAIWVGGAELVRHRDWFRQSATGFSGDIVFFFERCVKLFVVIPVLGVILFFVSTWTTVVGMGGVDAVRHTYLYEIDRLQSECAGITAYRQRDFLLLRDLRQSVSDVSRAARNERLSGAQTGSAGAGAVSAYFDGLAEWYSSLAENVAAIIDSEDPSSAAPHQSNICADKIDVLKTLLSRNAHDNYDLWAREFETEFNAFASTLNRWRQDRRIETFLDAQLDNFDRANPAPGGVSLSRRQQRAIDNYADDVRSALATLIRKQKLAKPPVPVKSYAELYPARGLEIFDEVFTPPAPQAVEERVSRRIEIVMAEFVPSLSTITPRDAVLKNANIFSDIWALAFAWDYAAYVLMLAYLFFPSAERAASFKDAPPPPERSFAARLFGLGRRH